MSELPEIATAEEVGKFLRVTTAAVERMGRDGKIGSLKQGRTRVFPAREVREYVKKHTVSATENQWGLADSTLKTIQSGRPARKSA